MKRLLFILALLGSAVSLHGQACNSGVWTQTAQEPSTCQPYAANGIFTHELPNAGSGGPTNHLAVDSDLMANEIVTNGGMEDPGDYNYMLVATPGFDAITSIPFYYGRLTDPLYYIASCAGNCNAAGTFWHIPNAATFSEGGTDFFFLVWDQTNDNVLAVYGMTAFPSCSATNQAQAMASCSINLPGGTGGQYSDYTTSKDYALAVSEGHAGNSLYSKARALVIRHKEWMEGTIRHALYLNVKGASVPDARFFPAPPGAEVIHLRLTVGTLLFLDYTDAQINAMGLPDWQKPLVKAMAHYGAYVGDGTPNEVGLVISRVEGGEAYEHAGGAESSLYDWLEAQVSPITGSPPDSERRWVLHFLDNIPNVGGTGVEDHIHIADECVPLGLAGLPGGCVDVPPPTTGGSIFESTILGEGSGIIH